MYRRFARLLIAIAAFASTHVAMAGAEELQGRIEVVTNSSTMGMSDLLSEYGCYPTEDQLGGEPYADHTGYSASVNSRESVTVTKKICEGSGLSPSLYVSFVSSSSDIDAKLVSPSGKEFPLRRSDYRDGYAYSFAVKPVVDETSSDEAHSTETGAWRLVVASSKPAKLTRFYIFTDSSY